MRRILGIDLGERRIGLALADGDGSPARPLQTIRRGRAPVDDASLLAPIVTSNQVVELVVGLPLEATGAHGLQAELTDEWAREIAAALQLPLKDHPCADELRAARTRA